jgi:hypothetical protein
MRTLKIRLLTAVCVLLTLPAFAAAQSSTTGAIAGIVKDTSGAVLPGVTVEASSPALIEKVRSAVSDGQGNYKIVELRPGIYTVTFTLPGFVTLKREGVEISSGVTANVGADMRVGGLEETVTVTGATPVVDIQNVRSQTILTREALDALPTNKTLQSFAALTLGAQMSQAQNQDVGGNQGEAGGFGYFAVHGGRGNDQRMMIEGMHFYALIGNGSAGNRTNYVNQMAVAEQSIQTGGYGAEAETGGVQINVVPRDGGNKFSGSTFTNGTSGKFQSSNLDDDLRAQGITTAPNVKNIYDLGVGLGGPLKQDKLWFYTAHRRWGTKNTVPGMFFNKTPGTGIYTADPTRPAFTWIHNRDHQGRITWQITDKMKLTASQGFQWDANEYYEVDRGRAPEGSTWLQWSPNSLTQTTWTYAKTNRLLFEAGQLSLWEDQTNSLVKSGDAGTMVGDSYAVDRKFVSISEIGGGFPNLYNGRANGIGQVDPGRGSRVHVFTQRASFSYITGSHALRVGFQGLYSPAKSAAQMPEYTGLGPVQYVYRFGEPFQLRQWRSPLDRRNRVYVAGIFAQDQWTLSRLTLNLGLRYDQLDGWVPPESVPAIPVFNLPALSFGEVRGVPNWKTLTPRFGAAYDLFGNGKTAIKGSLGKYNETESNGIASNNNPLNRIASQTLRSWADANGNRFPDCDLANSGANGECGNWLTPTFGTAAAATTFDPDMLDGWNRRPYSWQGSLSLQQQLANNVALNVGYFRTWFGKQRFTVNRAVGTVGVDEFCYTTPNDARLGEMSNRQLCGLYDAKRVAAPDNFATLMDNYGKFSEVSNFVDVGLQMRFGKGGLIQGGFSTGQTVIDQCDLVKSLAVPLNVPTYNLQPTGQGSRTGDEFCRTVNPWMGQTQFKAAVNYPLPYGVRVSGTLQNLPGLPVYGIVNITGAATTLGRALTTGSTNVMIKRPYDEFLDRLNQVDVRFSKSIRLAGLKVEGQFDVYNALNANTILQINPNYGASWRRPLAVLGARLLKFGAQIDF